MSAICHCVRLPCFAPLDRSSALACTHVISNELTQHTLCKYHFLVEQHHEAQYDVQHAIRIGQPVEHAACLGRWCPAAVHESVGTLNALNCIGCGITATLGGNETQALALGDNNTRAATLGSNEGAASTEWQTREKAASTEAALGHALGSRHIY